MSQATLTWTEAERPELIEDEPRYEVIDGQTVELPPMGIRETTIAHELLFRINQHAAAHDLGRSYTELLFKLFPNRDRKRRPDVAFVSFDRWPKTRPIPASAFWEVVPDLAVEVVSPTDPAIDLFEKIEDYFQAGTRRVWIILPGLGTVYDYQSPTSVTIHRATESLAVEDILPGFRFTPDALFQAIEGAPDHSEGAR